MKARPSTTTISAAPRRTFLRVLGVVCLAAAFPEADLLKAFSLNPTGDAPVVAFHMDLLYLDWSGRAAEYVPPAGLRSAEILGQLSETEFRWNFTYI